jgi:integrase
MIDHYDLTHRFSCHFLVSSPSWSGIWSDRRGKKRKGPLLLRFLLVKRCFDTVGACGSNPHAPTNFLSKFALPTSTAIWHTGFVFASWLKLCHRAQGGRIAKINDWITTNPFAKARAGELITTDEQLRETILTYEQERRLLKECEGEHSRHLKALVIAGLDTGARKGELLRLT